MQLPAFFSRPGYRRSLLIRRFIAAILVIVAVLVAIGGTLRSDPQVVVFSRALAAGDTVTAEDLRLVSIPAEAIPDGAITDPEAAAGRTVVTAAGRGEIVTDVRITGSALVQSFNDAANGEGAPEVTTVVPVRLADPATVNLLSHGDTVTILTSPSEEDGASSVLARGGRVVVADEDNPDTVLIALSEHDAQTVASASLTSPLGVVLTSAAGLASQN